MLALSDVDSRVVCIKEGRVGDVDAVGYGVLEVGVCVHSDPVTGSDYCIVGPIDLRP